MAQCKLLLLLLSIQEVWANPRCIRVEGQAETKGHDDSRALVKMFHCPQNVLPVWARIEKRLHIEEPQFCSSLSMIFFFLKYKSFFFITTFFDLVPHQSLSHLHLMFLFLPLFPVHVLRYSAGLQLDQRCYVSSWCKCGLFQLCVTNTAGFICHVCVSVCTCSLL